MAEENVEGADSSSPEAKEDHKMAAIRELVAKVLKGDRYHHSALMEGFPDISRDRPYKIPAHLRDQGIGSTKQPDHEQGKEPGDHLPDEEQGGPMADRHETGQ